MNLDDREQLNMQLWDYVENNTLKIIVTPKSSRNVIVVDLSNNVRVYLTCVPENGAANKEAIKLIAKALNVSKGSLKIIFGAKARNKIIQIGAK